MRAGPTRHDLGPPRRRYRIDVKNGETPMLADAQAQYGDAARGKLDLLQFDFLVADRHPELVQAGKGVEGVHNGYTENG